MQILAFRTRLRSGLTTRLSLFSTPESSEEKRNNLVFYDIVNQVEMVERYVYRFVIEGEKKGKKSNG
jgi:hypothetical protein